MKIKKNLFCFISSFCLILLMFTLSGCFSLNKPKGYNVYLNESTTSVADGNMNLNFVYGELTNIKNHITVKEITSSGAEKVITNYTIETSAPLNSETIPGYYTVTISYLDFNSTTINVRIESADTLNAELNVEESYVYSTYTLPTINLENRNYVLYYSTRQSYYSGTRWQNNTIPVGTYYVWADIYASLTHTRAYTDFYTITIKPKPIEIPTLKENSFTYNSNNITVELENCDSSSVIVSGDLSATNAGSYTINLAPAENYTWLDGSTNTKTCSWTINKAMLEIPKVLGEYVYNTKVQMVELSEYNNKLLKVEGVFIADHAGTYTLTCEPVDSSSYVLEDGSSKATISWEIKKANEIEPSEDLTLIIKKSSNISVLENMLPENFYLYNEKTLPFEDSFNWTLKNEQTDGSNTEKFYVSENTTEIHWVKKEIYNNSELISTCYYQEGNFKELTGIETVYLSYNTNTSNLNSYVVVQNINVEEKLTAILNLNVNNPDLVETETNSYTMNYNRTINTIDAVSSMSTPKLFYKNLETEEINHDGFKDAGEYEIWAEIEETEDLFNVKTNSIYVKVIAGEIETIENLDVPAIEYLDKLQNCAISGDVNYLGEVDGIFSFANPETMPVVADSNSTEYEFTFTPTDSNILPYTSTTKIVVNPGKLNYSTPTLDRGTWIKQGTPLSSIPIENDGVVTNRLGEVVLGTWELTSSTGLMHASPEFIFTPNDNNYETKIVKNNNNTTVINEFHRFTITTEPALKFAYKSNDEYFMWYSNGKFRIEYDIVGNEIVDFNIATFSVVETATGYSYYLHYADYKSNCGSIQLAPKVYSLEEFESAIEDTTTQVIVLNCDISMEQNLVATTQKIIVIPEKYSLSMHSYSIDFTNPSLKSEIINHGEIDSINPIACSFLNLFELGNYNTVSLAHLSSVNSNNPLTVKNYGSLEVENVSSRIVINNYNSVNINCASYMSSINLSNLTADATANISAEELFTFSGDNYGTVTIDAPQCVGYSIENKNGATINANEIQNTGEFILEETSTFNATLIRGSGSVTAYVSTLERFVDVLKMDAQDKKFYILSSIDLTNVNDIIDGDATQTESQAPLLITDEFSIAEGATLNLGGKNLVMRQSSNPTLPQFKMIGKGKICNGTITYNLNTLGSPLTEVDLIVVEYENIEFVNATARETLVPTYELLWHTLSQCNGRDINIILTDNIVFNSDLNLVGPTRITIQKNLTLTIGQNYYLNIECTEDGKYPKIIQNGELIYTRIPSVTQYSEDYKNYGSRVYRIFNENISVKHYIVRDVEDFATFKSMASSSAYSILRITKDFKLEESVTVSSSCKIMLLSGSSIDLAGYRLTLSYTDIDKYASIINSDYLNATNSGYITYTLNAARLATGSSKSYLDVLSLTYLDSRIKATCLITATTQEEMTAALRYSNESCRGHIKTGIYMQTNYTLTSDLTLRTDLNHQTYIEINSAYTLNLNWKTLTVPYVKSTNDYSSVLIEHSNARIKNGTIKYYKDSVYNNNYYLNLVSLSCSENITYVTY